MPSVEPEPRAKPPGPNQQQLINDYGPGFFEKPSGERTCGTCTSFDASASRCVLRKFGMRADLPACAYYVGAIRKTA